MIDTGSALVPVLENAVVVGDGAKTPPGLTSQEKAAIILATLGPKKSAVLLRELDEERINTFAKTIRELKNIDPQTVDKVIDDFLVMLEAEEGVSGGRDETRKFLQEVLEPEKVNRIMENIESSSTVIWKALDEIDDDTVIEWLLNEHPQVAAIVLTKISSAKSARVLEKFEDTKAREIVFRMSKAAHAPEAVSVKISEVVAREILPIAQMQAESMNPAELIAAVMNHVSSDVREAILGGMATDAPMLERDVRKIMFTYEDIATRVAPRDVGAIVKGVDEATLLRAFKAAEETSPETCEFILGNITKRLADRMREDVKDMDPVRKKDGETAQNEIVAAIVQMRDTGMINLIMEEEE